MIGLFNDSHKFGRLPDPPEPREFDERICDNCHLPDEVADQEEIDRICEHCPFLDEI